MKRWQRIKAELAHRLKRKRERKQRIWARRMLDTPRRLWPAGVSAYRVLMDAPLTARETRILIDSLPPERPRLPAIPLVQRGLVDAAEARRRAMECMADEERFLHRIMALPEIQERLERRAARLAGINIDSLPPLAPITDPMIQRIVTAAGLDGSPPMPPQSGYELARLAEAAGFRNEVVRLQEVPRVNAWLHNEYIAGERMPTQAINPLSRIALDELQRALGHLSASGAYTYNWPLYSPLGLEARQRNDVSEPMLDNVVSATAEEIREEIGRRTLPGDAPPDCQAAYARALATLRLFLTDAEQRQLSEHGYFTVPSKLTPGRVYHIPLCAGVVSVYDDGKQTMTLCCRPEDSSVPWPDVMLAYKLGLQADEARWLATANKWATNNERLMDDGLPFHGRTVRPVPAWNEVSFARLRPIPMPPRYFTEIDPLTVFTRSDANGLVEVREEWHP